MKLRRRRPSDSEELPEEQPAVQAAPQPSPSEEQPESEPAVPEEDVIEQLEKNREKPDETAEPDGTPAE